MKIPLFFLLVLFISPAYSQKSFEKDLQVAEAYMEIEEYENAMHYYQKAYTKHKSTEVCRKIAHCALLKHDYKTAELYFRQLKNIKDRLSSDVFNYAKVLHYNSQWKEASLYFNQYQKLNPSDSTKTFNLIASCDSALKWSLEKSICEVSNLSKINSEYSDIAPAFYKEGILFCSSREINIIQKKEGSSGLPFYDFYFSKENSKSRWNVPVVFSSELNTGDHEGPATFNSSFTEIYFTRCEDRQKFSSNNTTNHLKLYKSTKKSLGWSAPESFMFNDSSCSFAHPSISKNGKIFFFASDKPGGYGGSDLYVSFQLDSVLWSIPVNLGPSINTVQNELYPFFLEEEGLLYFASNGHAGMGGFDIYLAELDGKDWINITNLKPPINSSYDDFSFIITHNKEYAFFSSNRSGGMGKEDIYKVLFK